VSLVAFTWIFTLHLNSGVEGQSKQIEKEILELLSERDSLIGQRRGKRGMEARLAVGAWSVRPKKHMITSAGLISRREGRRLGRGAACEDKERATPW